MKRRTFLQIGIGSLTLPRLLQAQERSSRQTSVVMLYLGGGATHIETFSPIPDAPSEFRSVTGALQTNIPGIHIGGTFGRTSRIMDKLAIVRSFSHTNSGHAGGTHWVYTGVNNTNVDNGGNASHPSFGSVLSRFRGPSTQEGLPAYVKLGNNTGDGAAFIGSAFGGFDFSQNGLSSLRANSPANAATARRSLRSAFDNFRLPQGDAMDAFEVQAFELLQGRATRAFDIGGEPASVRNLYGASAVGDRMLMARRLCEAGVGVVTVNSGGWDMHERIEAGMREQSPPIDAAIAGFVEDIYTRGRDRDILLVICGEFGRTPRINTQGGRDHWATASTLALAGGGFRMGQVIGELNSRGEYPRTSPVTPANLHATIYRHLGIPHDLQYRDQSGRPIYMCDGVAIEGL